MRVGRFCVMGLLGLVGLVGALLGDAVDEANVRILNDAKYLASDELEGRGVGTEGLKTASQYIRDQFREAGLNVKTIDGEPFQKFELTTSAKLGMPNSLELVGPDGEKIELQMNQDYEVCSFGGSGTFDAEIVFCGYGIDAKDLKYDDFAGIDLTGKAALIMRRNPLQGRENSPFGGGHHISRHAELRTKLHNAVNHNAAAVIFVNDPYAGRKAGQDRLVNLDKANQQVIEAAETFTATDPNDAEKVAAARSKLSEAVNRRKGLLDAVANPKDDSLMPFGYAGSGDGKETTPAAVHITQSVCDRMLKPALGQTLAELEAAIDADFSPQSAVLSGWKARGAVTIDRVRSEVSNVIATLEGEGPLADENVIIGAHYDHVGRGGAGSLAPGSTEVHNGADDNASGTVACMELARRLAARPEKPPRRLVFIAFTGEEMGLLGSARYVREPVFPLEKTVAMFNMDMVGRLQDDKLMVFGTGTAALGAGIEGAQQGAASSISRSSRRGSGRAIIRRSTARKFRCCTSSRAITPIITGRRTTGTSSTSTASAAWSTCWKPSCWRRRTTRKGRITSKSKARPRSADRATGRMSAPSRISAAKSRVIRSAARRPAAPPTRAVSREATES